MLEGHEVGDNGLRWTMRLRDGLLFHDGSKVLARDCVASLKRWMKRDPIGASIAERLDALEAPDDRTLVWRLNKPFASLPAALCKTQPTPVIMPERLALTDPVQASVGGGGQRTVPFRGRTNRWPATRRCSRNSTATTRARSRRVSAAGGYRVLVDRVEWKIIADPATAANALVNNEVDWLDSPLPDLLPMLRKTDGVMVGPIDIYGTFGGLRPNCLQGPTMNRRRAARDPGGDRPGRGDDRRHGRRPAACIAPRSDFSCPARRRRPMRGWIMCASGPARTRSRRC